MEVQWKAISLNIRKVGIQIQYIAASVPNDFEDTFLIDVPCKLDCLGVQVGKNNKKECKKELSDIQALILKILSRENKTTIADLTRKTGLSARKISSELKALREDFHVLKREGGRKEGHWVIGDF